MIIVFRERGEKKVFGLSPLLLSFFVPQPLYNMRASLLHFDYLHRLMDYGTTVVLNQWI